VLYIVLVLVLAALGLLVTALISASSLWAWISIGLSVLAGLILVVDWLLRRSRRSAEAREVAGPEKAVEDKEGTGEPPEGAAVAEQTDVLPAGAELDAAALTEGAPATDIGADSGEADTAVAHSGIGEGDREKTRLPRARLTVDADPGEEQTDAADLVIISELEEEVVVVDEYPRYHVTACAWLVDRDTIPLGVSEARKLGFTPCVACKPDATLATQFRTKVSPRRSANHGP
jgi:hypothetical protein